MMHIYLQFQYHYSIVVEKKVTRLLVQPELKINQPNQSIKTSVAIVINIPACANMHAEIVVI